MNKTGTFALKKLQTISQAYVQYSLFFWEGYE